MNIQEATQRAIDLNLYIIRRKDWKTDDVVVCISIKGKGSYERMDMISRRTLYTVPYLPSVFDILSLDWEVVK